ncbi:kelch repeat-containing protein, partial [Flavobacteriaceae bacterium]|nr:kelch repeat-containing protein [Flavobacteriaceae bacterium]
INFKSNKVNIIPLNTRKGFLTTLPNTWVPNIPLNANIELIDSQVINQIYKKLSELKIVMSEKELFLIDNGGGMVFKIDLNDFIVERDDLSFTTMNKFGGDVFVYNDDIYHHGGYGLYVTNSTLIRYNKNYKTWDEIVVSSEFPNPKGISNHKSLIWNDEYYIIGGNSTVNQERIKNNKLLKYSFKTNSWQTLGNLNFEFNDDEIHATSYKEYLYIFDSTSGTVTTINVEKMETKSYSMRSRDHEFSNGQIANNNQIVFICNHLYSRLAPEKSFQKQKHILENSSINYFVANNTTYQASIFKSYLMTDFIDLKSKKDLILFDEIKSRNEFIIPIIIVLVILILNTFYKNYNKGKVITVKKLYSFEEGILKFNDKEIILDENSKMILELLHSKEQITSNDVVALLVDNGMSMDYASKIKNKTIERLNEKFEFITGSTENFIQTLKSKEDKRIQVIQLIKE